MLKKLVLLIVGSLSTNLARPVELPGVSFSHLDWQLVCDNTRTCRAAGYHADDANALTVSVLLTRKAGPGQAVTAKMQIGNYGNEDLFKTLPATLKLTTRIDNHAVGKITVSQKDLVAELPPAQVDALLAALTRNSAIAWNDGDTVWTLSGKGAAAVLLKMDEFQGRIGTIGALVRKGAKPEDTVLPPLPIPVVTAAPLPKPKTGDDRLAATQGKTVLAALRQALKSDDCDQLAEAGKNNEDLSLTRLSSTKLLASVHCWTAAYNDGSGYWVINDAPPYAPVLVTTMGQDFSEAKITSSQKGRGLGDCWSSDDWTWDGRQFVHTASTSTGMCRLVAPGGAWDLPTIVTEVRKPGAK